MPETLFFLVKLRMKYSTRASSEIVFMKNLDIEFLFSYLLMWLCSIVMNKYLEKRDVGTP